jgi:hypothetical protein
LLVREGRVAEAIALLRDELEQQQAPGVGLTRVPHLGLLAEAYGRARSPDDGLAVLDEAFDLAQHGGEHKVDALLHCLRAARRAWLRRAGGRGQHAAGSRSPASSARSRSRCASR